MQLYLEIFFSKLKSDEIIYLKHLVKIENTSSNPDLLVQEAFSLIFPNQIDHQTNLLIHSTSWRYEEPGRFIITYIVYSDEIEFPIQSTSLLPLQDLHIERGSGPKNPHPDLIKESNVISHGFRHLSFLAKNDPVIKKVIDANHSTRTILENMGVALFGSLN